MSDWIHNKDIKARPKCMLSVSNQLCRKHYRWPKREQESVPPERAAAPGAPGARQQTVRQAALRGDSDIPSQRQGESSQPPPRGRMYPPHTHTAGTHCHDHTGLPQNSGMQTRNAPQQMSGEGRAPLGAGTGGHSGTRASAAPLRRKPASGGETLRGQGRATGRLAECAWSSDSHVPAVPGSPARVCPWPWLPGCSLRGNSVPGRLAGASASTSARRTHESRCQAGRPGLTPGLAALTPRVPRSAGTATTHVHPATQLQMHRAGGQGCVRAWGAGCSVGWVPAHPERLCPHPAPPRGPQPCPVSPSPAPWWRCPGPAFARRGPRGAHLPRHEHLTCLRALPASPGGRVPQVENPM